MDGDIVIVVFCTLAALFLKIAAAFLTGLPCQTVGGVIATFVFCALAALFLKIAAALLTAFRVRLWAASS